MNALLGDYPVTRQFKLRSPLEFTDQVGAFGPRELATRFRDSRTGDVVSADFAALARAMGADGYRVEKPGDFGEALAAALASNGPSVIHVPVQADERPVATGGWVLPPLTPFVPTYRVRPDR